MKPQPNWRGDPTFIPDLFRHFGIPFSELPGWDKWGMGDYGRIQGVGWHHTGSENTSAQFIKHNGNMGGAASSLAHVSRKAVLTLCAIGISWHMGRGSGHGWPTNNANAICLGFEMQADGTNPWPEAQLDITRRATAAILWFLGKRATIETMIGHWEYSYAAQGKWDPGAGNGRAGAFMDMDHQRRLVNQYIDNINRYGRLDPPSGQQKGSSDVLTPKYFTDFIKGFLGPQIDALQEVWRQLRGPGGKGWAQLGQNAQGQNLTLVDGVAALRTDVARLSQKIDQLTGKDL